MEGSISAEETVGGSEPRKLSLFDYLTTNQG
jgi:hypothetical protein